ncbi:Methyl-accepting chemotaxis protein (MCP) signalling domain [Acididesulfobacillus acetoxydans]|uniref:Methyl-accepting chemotaxis (MCP) signaling domain protein n=1 Tax=Acididesulfobacillus acetoxydans TaxID=1561005 RepID=A0A8S0X739_9FIRM|nr:methyl-accepting chemotaxis protein [Acididesulfobacillus acetoxydans]CAA7603000.1 Methyl-accepting chemotaxis protein (MCP) signalling domain [Acididesulfobacillus acetoxydans]CEJ05882.1 Methyl-accepting chemotaxis (MCP) signaling domain protein [Acididesulfobacillus acetoxydans]
MKTKLARLMIAILLIFSFIQGGFQALLGVAGKMSYYRIPLEVLEVLIEGGVVFLLVWKSVIRPLLASDRVAREIALGDYFQEVPQNSGFFQSLLTAIAKVQESIHLFLGSAVGLSVRVHATADEIFQAFLETQAGTEEVTASVTQIAEQNSRQAVLAEEIHRLVASLGEDAGKAREQAGELAREAEEARKSSARGVETTRLLTETMGFMRENADKTHEAVERLSSESEGIGGVLKLIEGIAGQTSLLALNAAIEAARAGEAGRGFSVVAEEVKKLAEQSTQHVQEIRNNLGGITEGIERVAKSENALSEHLRESVKAVGQATGIFDGVAGAVRTMSGKVEIIVSAVQNISRSALDMQAQGEEIAAVTQATAASAEEVSAAMEEQSRVLERNGTVLAELTESANELQQWVAEKALNQTLVTRGKRFRAYDTEKEITREDLERLKRELDVDDIYLTDREGIFSLATQKSIEGSSIFPLNDQFRRVAAGEIPYYITPIIERVEDKQRFKFFVAPRPNGRGLMELALSADRILNLKSESQDLRERPEGAEARPKEDTRKRQGPAATGRLS